MSIYTHYLSFFHFMLRISENCIPKILDSLFIRVSEGWVFSGPVKKRDKVMSIYKHYFIKNLNNYKISWITEKSNKLSV